MFRLPSSFYLLHSVVLESFPAMLGQRRRCTHGQVGRLSQGQRSNAVTDQTIWTWTEVQTDAVGWELNPRPSRCEATPPALVSDAPQSTVQADWKLEKPRRVLLKCVAQPPPHEAPPPRPSEYEETTGCPGVYYRWSHRRRLGIAASAVFGGEPGQP